MSSRKLNITLLAGEWISSKGGLSTMDRELAIQLAKNPDVSVNFFLPKCSDEDRIVARGHNIRIVEAEERPGYEPVEWLAFPPKDLVIDIVIGHGVILGKQAQIIRYYHKCKWVQVVHSAPDELAMYKSYPGAISKGDQKQWAEIKLCKIADLVVAIGPKLMEFYSAFLSSCGKKVYNFTPGIFTEFSSLKLSSKSGKKFRLLVFGRGDPEDFEIKGYDIVSQAVAKLNDKSFHLTFAGASSEGETQLANDLIKQGLRRSQLIVKGYLTNREDLTTMLCASDLVVMPSRTEGFGLTALEALSAGVPILVTQNSGFGEALQEVSSGSNFIVDSEDPEAWAEAIKGVRQKGSEKALQDCGELQSHYAKTYSWETQCNDLVKMMKTLFSAFDETDQQSSASLGRYAARQTRDRSTQSIEMTTSYHQQGTRPSSSRKRVHSSSDVKSLAAFDETDQPSSAPLGRYAARQTRDRYTQSIEMTTSYHQQGARLSSSRKRVHSSSDVKSLAGNLEKELTLLPGVLDSLLSARRDAKQVVARLKESLQLDQASLEQPGPETKKWIRYLARKAKSSNRLDVVKHLREITPAGTTGPLLDESLDVRRIPFSNGKELTIALSGVNEWKLAAEKLGLNPEEIRYLDKRTLNPVDALLSYIANQRGLTVGELYEVLCDCGVPVIADRL